MADRFPTDDRSLVAAARRGDGLAFEVIARTHAPALRAILRGLGASREDTEDALQETWIAAHRALPAFRGDATLRSWLGRITVNAYRDLRRAAQRMLRRPEGRPESLASDPAERLASRDLAARVLSALEELPPRQRETLRLRVVEGLPYAEIAERLGVGRDAVRMNLVEARRKLLRRFGRELGS